MTLSKFNRTVQGWQIDRVLPCPHPEGHFTLVLSKGKRTKSLDVFGNDLGWWYEPTGKHLWVSFLNATPICDNCNLLQSDPKAKEPCGTFTTKQGG